MDEAVAAERRPPAWRVYGAARLVSGCQAGDNVDSRGRVHLVNGRTRPVATSTSEIAVQRRDGEVSKAIVRPSGDHASPHVTIEKSSWRTTSRRRVPSRFMIQTTAEPSNSLSARRRVNAMRVPSGDHAGLASKESAVCVSSRSDNPDLSGRINGVLRHSAEGDLAAVGRPNAAGVV